MTNFRLIHRSVVKEYLTGADPYIPGLVVLYSASPANVEVEHLPRAVGSSNYGFAKISKLVLSILFNYSVIPLRAVILTGLFVSLAGFYTVHMLY